MFIYSIEGQFLAEGQKSDPRDKLAKDAGAKSDNGISVLRTVGQKSWQAFMTKHRRAVFGLAEQQPHNISNNHG
jgi:hypothetical protein